MAEVGILIIHFVATLWRAVKYEDVYLQEDAIVDECRHGLDAFFEGYDKREHQFLDHICPREVYFNWVELPITVFSEFSVRESRLPIELLPRS